MYSCVDVIGRLGIYTLDGCTDHRTLLQFVVHKETLDSTLAMIVLDYQRPWSMLQSLDYWMKTLENHISSLSSSRLDELKQKGMSREKSCEWSKSYEALGSLGR